MAYTGAVVFCCREERLDDDFEVQNTLHTFLRLHLILVCTIRIILSKLTYATYVVPALCLGTATKFPAECNGRTEHRERWKIAPAFNVQK